MPLSGLTVLDLSRYLPGPQAAALLGDYGARVIRIETPRHAAARDRAQGIDGMDAAARDRARAADVTGRNKAQVLVDIFSGEGRAEVLRLVRGADVLIHDYRAATIATAGLTPETCRDANPRLVYAAISATGTTGPRAGAAGHDPLALALSGALSRMGPAPHLPGFPPADMLTAAHTAFAVMVALWRRAETGTGAVLDAAMSDSALALMASVFGRMQRTGEAPPLDHPIADNAVFETADGGHVVATNMERAFWDRFCDAVDRPDLKPRFAGGDRPGLLAELNRLYATRTRAEWEDLAALHDLQIAPVLSPAEALREPHHHARGALTEGLAVLPGRPVRIAGLPPARPRPAGEPGRDQAVLREAVE
ncbi:CoA transferase [Psychromarinibacter sp. C21-152]|uniref:CoA transferase n=1 Tax=Psychromarinibacter sediminicola TaxID=3033385 RepID=A0AAE3NN14_9RHOB|nr:CoA transferase [Psychromarinibacter sediminicola]MDF0599299.1 CoA transferase [Psychromarinibacter sediminicola]